MLMLDTRVIEDGIYSENTPGPSRTPSPAGKDKHAKPPPSPRDRPNRTLLTIPSKVIHASLGLAIFTTVRAGVIHASGSTGSGVLIARLADGSWSAPSGVQIHGVGAGLMLGADIYDCVVVINTKEALRAFMQTRMALGTDLAVSAGPWGAGGSVDVAAPPPLPARPGPGTASGQGKAFQPPQSNQPPQGHPGNLAPNAPNPNAPAGRPPNTTVREKSGRPQPVYSYVKSRGFYVGVAVDGTVVTERKDANASFYGRQVSVQQILHGEVPPPHAAQGLLAVVRGAEGWHAQGQGQSQGQSQGQGYGQGAAQGYGQGPANGFYAPAQGRAPSNPKTNYPPSGPSNPTYSQPQDTNEAVAARWKEAEVAEDARRNAGPGQQGPPPPMYTDAGSTTSTEIGEMPPAYVDTGAPRPGVGDGKSAAGPGAYR